MHRRACAPYGAGLPAGYEHSRKNADGGRNLVIEPEPKSGRNPLKALLSLLHGTRGMWLFALVMVGATVIIYVEGAHSFGPPAVSVDIPWWSIAVLYCLAGLFVVRFQYVRESVSFSLIEVPLVLGLFFLTPGELLSAALLGSLVAGGVVWKETPPQPFFYT